MALFNYVTKEITLKVVYYGPGLSGKTTNLQQLHATFDPKKTGKLLALSTETDRTLFFDFLPVKLGKINEFTIRFQLYTVPGQVRYNSTKRLVLRGADAVVFVADSQTEMKEQNIESFDNMIENLEANNIDPNDTPCVIQYNKRDLPAIMSANELNKFLNSKNHEYVLAAAINGTGVKETFQRITTLLLKHIAKKHKVEISPESTSEPFPAKDEVIPMSAVPETGAEAEVTQSASGVQEEEDTAPEPADAAEEEEVFELNTEEEEEEEGEEEPLEVESGEETLELMQEATAAQDEAVDVFELDEEPAAAEDVFELEEEPAAAENIFELEEEPAAAEEEPIEIAETEEALEPDTEAIEITESDESLSPEEEILSPIEEEKAPEPAPVAEAPSETPAEAPSETPYSAEKISIMFDSLIELSTSLSSAVTDISSELNELKEQQAEVIEALKEVVLSTKKPDKENK